jgi:hypothetical protein
VETVRSLEEARVYRFESSHAALAAATLYATSLGLTEREARVLAGLSVRPRLVDALLSRRALASLAFCGALGAAAWFAVTGHVDRGGVPPAPAAAAPAAPAADPSLPPAWQVEVAVYNGSEHRGAAAAAANEIAALAYRIGAVENAPRRDYPDTRVYYAPGGEAIAERLADQLSVGTAALPGGDDPNRLVVIVGAR